MVPKLTDIDLADSIDLLEEEVNADGRQQGVGI